MSEKATTSNGYEIDQAVPRITAEEFRDRMAEVYGISGDNPDERVNQLKQLSVEGIAIMLEDINKAVQGSANSLISHDEVVKIGGKETIKPQDRYDVFLQIVNNIKASSRDITPERVWDVLALAVVLLHPFHDGNGRTARALGLMGRDAYNSQEYEQDFKTVTDPRDIARETKGFMINGYVPRFPEGFDQSDASQVSAYLSSLLQEENKGAYTSCYGQAPLHAQTNQAA